MKSVKPDAYEVGHTFTLLFNEKNKTDLVKICVMHFSDTKQT